MSIIQKSIPIRFLAVLTILSTLLATFLTVSIVSAQGMPAACNWQVVSTPKAGQLLSGVAALSANNIWAVGITKTSEDTLIEQWNGSAWSIVPSPNPGGPGSLNAVSAVSAQDIWAVGSGGTIAVNTTLTEHWNGTAWSIVPSPNPGTGGGMLKSVAAISSKDVWAVGQTTYNSSFMTHTLIEHWDGAAWSVVTSPSPGTGDVLMGIAATSATDIWAAGVTSSSTSTAALVEHWDGTTWTIVTLPKLGISSQLKTVAAVSANDVWTIGTQGTGTALALHWDGTNWKQVTIPNPGGLIGTNYYSLAVVSANDIWAVGFYFTTDTDFHTVSAQWDGTSWKQVASPSPQPRFDSFQSVTVVPGTSQVWAVGYTGNGTLAATHC